MRRAHRGERSVRVPLDRWDHAALVAIARARGLRTGAVAGRLLSRELLRQVLNGAASGTLLRSAGDSLELRLRTLFDE